MRVIIVSIRNFVRFPVDFAGYRQKYHIRMCKTLSHAKEVKLSDQYSNKCELVKVQDNVSVTSDKSLFAKAEGISSSCSTEVQLNEEDSSIINPCNEDISTFAPYYAPSFNFAAYINKSQTLQELVNLGVDLHRLEKKEGVPELLLQMDFDRDMKKHIRFLHDVGVPPDELGAFITKSPWIFKEDLDNLEVRINYLQSKKFSRDMVTRIVRKNPYWLLYSTARIDQRLGYFQKAFKLSGNEVRSLAARKPRLITYNVAHIKVNTFTIKEEMGFSDDEIRSLLLKEPQLWMKSNKPLLTLFDYVHNVMKLPHQQILNFPQVLKSRIFRVKQRHQFLEFLERAQYDPKLEGYVSPKALVSGTDSEFCQTVARSSVEAFNIFLKSL